MQDNLEIVSTWLNRHIDELCDELKIVPDNDSPKWIELEKQILKTVTDAQIKRIEIWTKLRTP
jgi:hypothetical protein